MSEQDILSTGLSAEKTNVRGKPLLSKTKLRVQVGHLIPCEATTSLLACPTSRE